MTDDIEQPGEGLSGSVPSDQELNAIELRGLIEKLSQEQIEARRRAAYGGMNVAEMKAYDERRERISRLSEQLLRANKN